MLRVNIHEDQSMACLFDKTWKENENIENTYSKLFKSSPFEINSIVQSLTTFSKDVANSNIHRIVFKYPKIKDGKKTLGFATRTIVARNKSQLTELQMVCAHHNSIHIALFFRKTQVITSLKAGELVNIVLKQFMNLYKSQLKELDKDFKTLPKQVEEPVHYKEFLKLFKDFDEPLQTIKDQEKNDHNTSSSGDETDGDTDDSKDDTDDDTDTEM